MNKKFIAELPCDYCGDLFKVEFDSEEVASKTLDAGYLAVCDDCAKEVERGI
jgi:hypothetical protein